MKWIFVALAILVSGCASDNVKLSWYNPEKTSQQIQMDEAECRNIARFADRGTGANTLGQALILGVIQNRRINDVYTDCMISKGYTLINVTNSVAKK